MAGENVKASAQPFKKHYPRQRVFPDFSSACPEIIREGLRCRNKSFDDFIQHQIQALIFCYFFIKEKVRARRGGERKKARAQGIDSQSIKISFAEHFVVPACAGMTDRE